ncbi:MAG TPA: MATE family efflux transporter [candidate division Zixibacteria bacterium]|nr:MATE family efflux transporter [candidate division Zixibacteria bacterium]MDD4918705.1 MATE family efflux transporter [candidate division Zixibacteria bacterium]MDM7973950.1 MATE family efflux transporter [candidate division Zixibacteria bacterium]HOD65791.1 MATE family efflux transporter [candidate division Zixibacteria bacterium]HOZ06893.1 MATE family efflux transporter [candidate division Zixibacteria bacterium]
MTRTETITSGPISGTIISLATPVVLAQFMEFALASTDYFWVGRLGPFAQDALTTSMVTVWTMFSAVSVISVGVAALVARHIGAGNPGQAAFFARQGMGMGVLFAIAAALAAWVLTPPFLRFMQAGPQTLPMAQTYMRTVYLFALCFFLLEVSYAVFRAAGDTRTPTIIAAITIVLNIGLDPLLIFGWGPVPAMGVAGAALATGLSVTIAAALALTRLAGGHLGFRLGPVRAFRPDFRQMLRIARIGLPIASQQFIFVAVYWFLIKYVHAFGPTAGAAMGIGNRMESFSYLICSGFAVAASTMVGQNLGAGKPDRAARCAWGATGIAVAVTLAVAVVFVSLPRAIASVFTDDPEVLRMAADYLVILGLSQFTMAVEIVLEGAFSGSGDTLPPMLVSVPGSLARIPLAYLLAFTLGWGINGVWWTLTITTTVKALVLAYWFSRGRWKRKEV